MASAVIRRTGESPRDRALSGPGRGSRRRALRPATATSTKSDRGARRRRERRRAPRMSSEHLSGLLFSGFAAVISGRSSHRIRSCNWRKMGRKMRLFQGSARTRQAKSTLPVGLPGASRPDRKGRERDMVDCHFGAALSETPGKPPRTVLLRVKLRFLKHLVSIEAEARAARHSSSVRAGRLPPGRLPPTETPRLPPARNQLLRQSPGLWGWTSRGLCYSR